MDQKCKKMSHILLRETIIGILNEIVFKIHYLHEV